MRPGCPRVMHTMLKPKLLGSIAQAARSSARSVLSAATLRGRRVKWHPHEIKAIATTKMAHSAASATMHSSMAAPWCVNKTARRAESSVIWCRIAAA